MKISVVIPAHNEEKSLPVSLPTVIAQDYPDFEIIVVDNASDDGTSDVVRKFMADNPNTQIKLIMESRKGLLWAREAGRRAASGDIIANMDADCLPSPDWLSKGVKYFADPKIVAVSGPYDYYDGGFVFRYISLCTQMSIYWLTSRIIQLPFVKTGAVMIGGNNMIRAEALHKAGGYNTARTFYGEDTDTAMRIAPFGRILFMNRLQMKTSARRFRHEGIVKLQLKYLKHFFKLIFSLKQDLEPE
ncbi:MAG: glycosyltransferase family 2 protein [Patescibacteria group bacterium]|nr:glycosyltransferase family 2 protein [Patescibacteria group bacterium]